MANHFDASTTATALDLLLIGHVTRDLIDPADFTTYRLGGTVSFAAVTAARLGRKATIFTRAAPDMDYSALPPEVDLHVLPSKNTTTFANVYTPHGRVQYVFTPSEAITAADIPAAMRNPSAVLLGPLVGEVTPDVAAIFGPGTLVAAVPQGWMRRWDDKGRVRSKEWDNAAEILPHLDVLVLSLEDIDYDWNRLARAFDHVPMIVVTEYKEGSTVFQRQPDGSVVETKIPPRAAVERDPTGAGDTFTTAFLLHLQETGDPLQAARFGNITASISVEYPGVTGIPTRDEVLSHMDEYPFDPNPQRSQYEANLA